MKVIEIKGLEKSFGNQKVIKGLNLSLEEGEIFGLIGPNGAGKSTLIKLILQLIKKDCGEITFFEGHSDTIEKEIGATIEEPCFYEYLTGEENLKLYKNILGLHTKDIHDAMEMTGIIFAKDKKVSQYSMGMKQRLAISRAILSNPKLLLLDEPTNGLDPKAIIDLRELIKQLNHMGTTIIFCSHHLSEVKNICSSFGFLYDGVITKRENMNDSDSQIAEMEELFL
ncbi:putative mutacin ABC transporter, ATP-binding protein MutF [Peptostreptococcaceae bacterium oral taxon 113 str. W5053]|nr:putative mutacin ABC transporter, ATP-binding protein MutF [Peptostreptococcaceae bacterium oral taxon 113 str. W5053]